MSKKIGFIGGGNMGGAILAGICHDYTVFLCENDKKRAQTLKRKYKVILTDLTHTMDKCDVIILAVKPQHFEALLKDIAPHFNEKKVLVSVAAGIKCSYIEKFLGKGARVVRVMPNLPVQVKEGMAGICCGKYAKPHDMIFTSRIFNRIGKSVVVKENEMDAVTAVSGSGPAYVFQFAEHLTKAALKLGLKKDIAEQLVLQTLKGSVALLEKSREDASVLRQRVTSKGGTTQAALDVLDQQKLDQVYTKALSAAKKRAKDLSKA